MSKTKDPGGVAEWRLESAPDFRTVCSYGSFGSRPTCGYLTWSKTCWLVAPPLRTCSELLCLLISLGLWWPSQAEGAESQTEIGSCWANTQKGRFLGGPAPGDGAADTHPLGHCLLDRGPSPPRPVWTLCLLPC